MTSRLLLWREEKKMSQGEVFFECGPAAWDRWPDPATVLWTFICDP